MKYSQSSICEGHKIVIYALDNNTQISRPQQTTLNVGSPLRKKAIIAVGTDPASPEWPVAKEAALAAYETLKFHQYEDSGPEKDIMFFSPMRFNAGVDGTRISANLRFAINTWASSNTQDLLVYLIGPGNTDSFRLNASQTLAASTLYGWLDTLQSTLPGVLTVLYDGPKSGSFRDDLLPPPNKKRIFIASTNDAQSAAFVPAGAICFSRFFWRDVANGANVGGAFRTARIAIEGSLKLQMPGLDDNSNGIVNDKTDGSLLAGRHNLDSGIVLAGDAPLIAGDTGDVTISSGTAHNFGVTDVTSTGTIVTVWAMIMPPGYSPVQSQRLVTVDLSPKGDTDYSTNYTGFTEQGDYTVAVFAEDIDGVISLPRVMTITQPSNQYALESGGGGCFIATAAYGTPMARELDNLRRFRDQSLLRNSVGAAFVDAYYRTSPPAALWLTERREARTVIRVIIRESMSLKGAGLSLSPPTLILLGIWILLRYHRSKQA